MLTINPPTHQLFTYADYLTWEVKERLELIKGKIFRMSPAPNALHQRIATSVAGEFYQYLRKKTCRVYTAPFDVRLYDSQKSGKDADIRTVVQPDICIICDPTKIDYRGCLGAPDLVVEIISPSTAQKDMTDKFRIYEENGVREYWVVFPDVQLVQVYDLQEHGAYQLRKTYNRTEQVPVGIFTDYALPLSEVFEELPPETDPEGWVRL